ncbi:MAG TPA: RIP metalloprotease RseP [Burkholderiales bacterium]|nr:RIP metalloprotease RseP [Burkholderiales bacterium]
MEILIKLASFIVALGVLIVFHELGHYLVARMCNVKVLRFSMGFGKRLYTLRAGKDQTEWVLSAFPLGGYVKMLDEREGEVAEAEAHRAFNRQPVLKRFAIVIAGPVANFLLAIMLYWVLFVTGFPAIKPYVAAPTPGSPAAIAGLQNGDVVRKVDNETIESWQDLRWALLNHGVKRSQVELEVESANGAIAFRTLDLSALDSRDIEAGFSDKIGLSVYRPRLESRVGRVQAGSVADAAGLKADDLIVAIDGKQLSDWDAFVNEIRVSPGKRLVLSVQRANEVVEIPITPAASAEGERTIGKVGLSPFLDEKELAKFSTTVKYPVGESLVKAAQKTWEMSIFSLKMLGKMVIGEVSWKNLSGPVTIADYAGQSAQLGWMSYLTFLALISISLGVLNLLPIPLLDGGHLMYYVIEMIKGSPVSEQAMEIGSRIGFFLLMGLMAFAFYNDINRLLSS